MVDSDFDIEEWLQLPAEIQYVWRGEVGTVTIPKADTDDRRCGASLRAVPPHPCALMQGHKKSHFCARCAFRAVAPGYGHYFDGSSRV